MRSRIIQRLMVWLRAAAPGEPGTADRIAHPGSSAQVELSITARGNRILKEFRTGLEIHDELPERARCSAGRNTDVDLPAPAPSRSKTDPRGSTREPCSIGHLSLASYYLFCFWSHGFFGSHDGPGSLT
jgi:hypothetical protein